MSSDPPPEPYRVSYSDRVRDGLRELIARMQALGRVEEVLAAARKIDRLLHIYPQFGEPVIDLKAESGQICIGTISPLVVRYAIFDERRLVVVAIPMRLLGAPVPPG